MSEKSFVVEAISCFPPRLLPSLFGACSFWRLHRTLLEQWADPPSGGHTPGWSHPPLGRVRPRGFRDRVLSLVSVYAPVSGAGFDHERRVMFDCLSNILGCLPFRSVWVVGGHFNAEVGCRGIGEESSLG